MQRNLQKLRIWRVGKRAGLVVAGVTAAVGTLAFAAETAAAADCGALAGKTYGAAKITAATNVSPHSSLAEIDSPAPVALDAPFCRVEGTIKTSDRSNVGFEVWLPEKAAWNGKYQGVGNGGWAGSMRFGSMNQSLVAGYAVSATDTGHTGHGLDATWALGEPEKLIDFGWRAIHVTAEAAKAIIADYYQKAPAHSYFSACSNGGRQALLEAERFPKDYDGIVAGAPAINLAQLETNAIWSVQALNQPGAWISPEKLTIVTKAVLAQCHGEIGYVEDPARCRFDPASLVCKAGQSDGCLSEAETAALKKIYSGAQDANGKPIYPGYTPGGEAGPTAWSLWLSGRDPARASGGLMGIFSTGYFAEMVFNKADWRSDGQNISDALAAADKATGATLDTPNPDLGAFQAAGGKLIQYHGWNDAGIPAQSSVNWYEQVASKMGGLGNVQSFYRLFMAPE